MLFRDPPQCIPTESVLRALRAVRVRRIGVLEQTIHDAVRDELRAAGFVFRREYTFSQGCRADIWVDGIVIEVKKLRPVRAKLCDQLTRYARHERVRELVVVLEKSVALPRTIEGKPVHVISLNAQWGIAL